MLNALGEMATANPIFAHSQLSSLVRSFANCSVFGPSIISSLVYQPFIRMLLAVFHFLAATSLMKVRYGYHKVAIFTASWGVQFR